MNHNKTLHLQNTTTKTHLLENKMEKMTHLNNRKHVNYITSDHVLLLKNDSDLNELTKLRTDHAILQ